VSDEEKEKRAKPAKMVQEEIESAIERCLQESDLTYAEVLGALDLVHAATVRRYFKRVEPEL
jgi:hypothetical protein